MLHNLTCSCVDLTFWSRKLLSVFHPNSLRVRIHVRLQAVCCSDLEHCCPSEFRCNLVTQMCEKLNQPWMNIPMVKKEAAEKPSTPVIPVSPLQELKNNLDPKKSSIVRCDATHACPDRTTCCRHPAGAWFCCPYSPVS